MRIPKIVKWFLFIISISIVQCAWAQISFQTEYMKITLDKRGQAVTFTDAMTRTELLYKSDTVPFIRIKYNGQICFPSSVDFDSAHGVIRFGFLENHINISIQVTRKEHYLVFEVIQVIPEKKIDQLIWGSFPLQISEMIGEIIGVVRNNKIAVGLQVMNPKTLGGYPLYDEGSDPSRGNTATKTSWGSQLQAYSLDRSKPRTISVWWDQFPNMPVPPIPEETIVGSMISLFVCPADQILRLISEIEVNERLPHPLIDGSWSKQSTQAGRSYLIADFSEETIDELLGYTQRANLMTLYHMNPWRSWGHYEIDTIQFPHGVEGMKTCVVKAKRMGIRIGAHTLTNFINTHDPYVSPIPDQRLARTGCSRLIRNAKADATEIYVENPVIFNNEKANWLHTVMIGTELITYKNVTLKPPYKLLDCKRGAFGTHPTSHKASEEVSKLMDHPYKVFFPDMNLMQEIARNLAMRFNETGLEQMDFDGFEGCLSTGQGDYAIELFAKTFYDNLNHSVINGTSMSKPFYWHINTYCNWGEPWYGGFRESMQEYRMSNQSLFDRNYLPHMLGWYLLTDSTSLPDIEWMLARAAGYDAGFAIATSLEALRTNPNTTALLDAIREWELCRRDHAFSEEIKEILKDPSREFHLSKVHTVVYDLYPVIKVENPNLDQPIPRLGEPIRIIIPVR